MTIANNTARNAEIVKLYTKGGERLSMSQIAYQVGCTRNVVAGAIFRAGVASRLPQCGVGSRRSGSGGNNAVLDADTVRHIRRVHTPFDPALGTVALARRYGVTAETIRQAIRGRTWAHVQ